MRCDTSLWEGSETAESYTKKAPAKRHAPSFGLFAAAAWRYTWAVKSSSTLRAASGLLIAGLLGTGCKNEASKTNAEPPKPAAPAVAAAPTSPATAPAPAAPPAPLNRDGVAWEDPKGWEKIPGSGMRHTSYKIPAAKGDKDGGELVVYYFGPTQGGEVDSNINRWVAQFEGADVKAIKRTDRTVNDIEQHIVEIPKGTYDLGASSMSAVKKVDNYGLLGAIVVAPTGKYFFKLTGPMATVKAAHDPFYKLLDSVKAKSPT
jgi:hypothetical protein